jgi:hypothetical protein
MGEAGDDGEEQGDDEEDAASNQVHLVDEKSGSSSSGSASNLLLNNQDVDFHFLNLHYGYGEVISMHDTKSGNDNNAETNLGINDDGKLRQSFSTLFFKSRTPPQIAVDAEISELRNEMQAMGILSNQPPKPVDDCIPKSIDVEQQIQPALHSENSSLTPSAPASAPAVPQLILPSTARAHDTKTSDITYVSANSAASVAIPVSSSDAGTSILVHDISTIHEKVNTHSNHLDADTVIDNFRIRHDAKHPTTEHVMTMPGLAVANNSSVVDKHSESSQVLDEPVSHSSIQSSHGHIQTIEYSRSNQSQVPSGFDHSQNESSSARRSDPPIPILNSFFSPRPNPNDQVHMSKIPISTHRQAIDQLRISINNCIQLFSEVRRSQTRASVAYAESGVSSVENHHSEHENELLGQLYEEQLAAVHSSLESILPHHRVNQSREWAHNMQQLTGFVTPSSVNASISSGFSTAESPRANVHNNNGSSNTFTSVDIHHSLDKYSDMLVKMTLEKLKKQTN